MAHPAPTDLVVPARYATARYFALLDKGVLGPDDRVELLEGVIVAMSPKNPRHDAGVARADDALRAAVGQRAAIRVQMSLVLGPHSVPEPDLAVVPGQTSDYDDAHPTTALLVVEVADTSLVQDRLTKAAIYAAAGVPEYWIVNLRDDRVGVFRRPNASLRKYEERRLAGRGEQLDLAPLPGARVAVDDLLPRR